jgi:hypothetical protein
MYFLQIGWYENKESKLGQILFKDSGSLEGNVSAYMTVGESESQSDEKQSGGKVKKVMVKLPILDDFTYELKSAFGSMADAMGEIGGLVSTIIGLMQTLNKLGGATGGTVSEGNDHLKLQVWNDTEPLRFTVKAMLHTQTNPYKDVYLPSIAISAQTILTSLGEGRNTSTFLTPGVNMKAKSVLTDIKNRRNSNTSGTQITTDDKKSIEKLFDAKTNKILTDMRVFTVNADGQELILLDASPCFIETAKPTYSKEQTESGYPLWCELELTIQSVYSASDLFFNYSKNEPNKKSDFKLEAMKIVTNVFR